MNAEKRRAIFERLARIEPQPKTELAYRSTFELLVAVALSAQATDKSVNLATRGLFAAAPTPQAMAALGAAGIEPHIKTIGLFRNKAKNVARLAEILRDEHGGRVPATREALETLPGVGRKTANVVLNIAFGEPTIAVDTHIFRVANRTGLAPGKTVDQVEAVLIKTTPKDFRQHAHHWLILHGRYVCKARKPECWRCPIKDLCDYKSKVLEP